MKIIKNFISYFKKPSFLNKFNFKDLPGKLLFLLFFLVLFKLFDLIYDPRSLYYSITSGLIIWYSLIVIIISLILVTLTNNVYKAGLIIAFILSVILFANWVKNFFVGTPFLLTDILILKAAGEIVNFVTVRSILLFILRYLIQGIMLVFLLMYFFNILNKYFNYTFFNNSLIRLSVLTCSLMIAFIMITPNKKISNLILDFFYANTKEANYQVTYRSGISYYKKLGIVLGTFHSTISSYHFVPDHYNEKLLNDLLKSYNYKTNDNQQLGTPNIIVVFSESFWNPEELPGIKFNQQVTPNFNKLIKTGQKVDILSPTFGGVSANVEFQLLTGLSLNYFTEGYIPYISLYRNQVSAGYPSLVKELQNNDYSVEILNTASKNLYDCAKVYNLLKIDHVDYIDNKEGYATDEEVTDLVIKRFNNKQSNERLFYLAITMGGHMPYYKDKFPNNSLKISTSKYDQQINNIIQNYARLINQADQELGRLNDYINTLDEPTILIFFGDHLPFLKTKDNQNIYQVAKYFSNDLEGIAKQYTTPALILANYELSSLVMPNTLSPDMLLNNILNNSALELSPYYQWLYSINEHYGAANSYITKKGDYLYQTNNLPQDINYYHQLRERMQYKILD